MDTQNIIIAIIGGYLLGSVPFGLLITKLAGLGDIRQIGSGNIGATNVLRTGRKDLALATLLLDSGKGALAVLFAKLYITVDVQAYAGMAAFIGHCYPIYLKFKGGKGVATFLGTAMAIKFPVGVVIIITWLLAAFVSKMSSLAALIAAIAGTIAAVYYASPGIWVLLAIMTLFIFIRHKGNIRRILKGEEPKIGEKTDKKDQ